MPARNVTKTPQHKIEECVKRKLAGESVATLAKYYKVSRPAVYLWLAKSQREALAKGTNHGRELSPKDAETADKRVLIEEHRLLKLENQKLRDKVMELLFKTGEI